MRLSWKQKDFNEKSATYLELMFDFFGKADGWFGQAETESCTTVTF